jgi:anti-sigma factor NepR-like protein
MQTDVHVRKGRGRLSREVMQKLGKTLEAYFDDVRKEGVPDRFKDLLRQFEEGNGPVPRVSEPVQRRHEGKDKEPS